MWADRCELRTEVVGRGTEGNYRFRSCVHRRRACRMAAAARPVAETARSRRRELRHGDRRCSVTLAGRADRDSVDPSRGISAECDWDDKAVRAEGEQNTGRRRRPRGARARVPAPEEGKGPAGRVVGAARAPRPRHRSSARCERSSRSRVRARKGPVNSGHKCGTRRDGGTREDISGGGYAEQRAHRRRREDVRADERARVGQRDNTEAVIGRDQQA